MKGIVFTCWLCAAFALACGGEEPAQAPAAEAPAAQPAAQEAQPAAQPAPTAPPEVTLAPDADGIVRVTGNDQMRFNGSRIEAKAGQKIKIELKNAGTLPKEAMGHNLVVLKPGTDPVVFATTKAMGAKASDYIPAGAAEVVAHTKLLGPGEADTIEVELAEPGTYPFVCTFPGHAALMKGVLVVGGA